MVKTSGCLLSHLQVHYLTGLDKSRTKSGERMVVNHISSYSFHWLSLTGSLQSIAISHAYTTTWLHSTLQPFIRNSQLLLVSVLYIVVQDNAILNRRKLEFEVIHGQSLFRLPTLGNTSHGAFLELAGSCRVFPQKLRDVIEKTYQG